MDPRPTDQSRPQPKRPTRARGCELTLVKGRHTWRFCCEHAEEPSLLSVIADIASSSQAGLDQFDLAVLASQLQDHFAADHEEEICGSCEPHTSDLSTDSHPDDRSERPVRSDDFPTHHAT